jgi:hypothetical protein
VGSSIPAFSYFTPPLHKYFENTASDSSKAGVIIHGLGRFQGIKGIITTSSKRLPPEKGELEDKTIGKGTLNYTLPSK